MQMLNKAAEIYEMFMLYKKALQKDVMSSLFHFYTPRKDG